MTVVKLVRRVCRFSSSGLNGKRLHHATCIVRKDDKTNSVEEETVSRKEAQIKWQSTNRQFFGPLIENSSDSQKKNSSIFKFKDRMQKLLPVGLWSDLAVQKYGRKNHFVSSVRNNSSDSDSKPSVVAPKRSKVPSAPLVKPSPNEPCRGAEETPVLSAEPDEDDTSDLPGMPFFQRNCVILPFPMILNKKEIQKEDQEVNTEVTSLPSPETKYPSVTTILKETMSKDNEIVLDLWRKRKVAEVGEDGFKEFMRDAFYVGKQLHTSIETRLRGVDYNAVHVDPRISGHWLSLKAVLNSLEDVRVLESCVVHRHLKYKGFVDCVARHKGQLVAIEWKTSARVKNTLKQAYDDPVQIAAYIGALNADDNYPFKISDALIVVAYPTGRPADVMQLDRAKCEHYWLKWLKRLEKFNQLKGRTPESIS